MLYDVVSEIKQLITKRLSVKPKLKLFVNQCNFRQCVHADKAFHTATIRMRRHGPHLMIFFVYLVAFWIQKLTYVRHSVANVQLYSNDSAYSRLLFVSWRANYFRYGHFWHMKFICYLCHDFIKWFKQKIDKFHMPCINIIWALTRENLSSRFLISS